MEQTLNLINVDKSDIKYTIVNFSDGESHIKFTTEVNRKYPVTVFTRISSWNDLMLLMQVGDILNRMEVDFSLYIKYLLTMRMDRVISFNEAYSLKITANMINSLGAKSVTIVEPHSQKTLDLINNSHALETIWTWKNYYTMRNTILVFPDAGAKERYAGMFVNDHGNTNPIVTCKKVRNPNTGELLSFEIETPEVIDNLPDGDEYDFLVIDDLCDNGGTFIGISKLLDRWPDITKRIAVTHMVNANGIVNLSKNYDKVYITDSYKNWDNLPENVKIVQEI